MFSLSLVYLFIYYYYYLKYIYIYYFYFFFKGRGVCLLCGRLGLFCDCLKQLLISQVVSFGVMDVRLKHPFTCVIAGPTGSGKTQFVKRLFVSSGDNIEPTPNNIIWCYGEYQDAYDHLARVVPEIRFVEGFPDDLLQSLDRTQRNIIVIDDLMSETRNNTKVTELFTKGSHHKNLSVILILQNLFYRGKEMRTISLNSHYMVLFKNPRDASQITHLAKQMYPNKSKYMVESYRDATSTPYSYLFVDLKPTTSEEMRLRTNIFKGEFPVVYVPKI